MTVAPISDESLMTTLSTTRSEIIVPVFAAGRPRCAGLIDVESEKVDGFVETDLELLEKCACAMSPLWES